MFVILLSSNHGRREKYRRRISLCCLPIETLFMAVTLFKRGHNNMVIKFARLEIQESN
jgi:hypothetical protein